jgi:uncharacterized protein (DUF1786 family)
VERGQPPDYFEKSFNFKDFRKIFGKSEGFGENLMQVEDLVKTLARVKDWSKSALRERIFIFLR